MRFKIKKFTEITKTNIFGKVLVKKTYFKIYRPVLFGLVRFYLYIKFYGSDWHKAKEIYVGYSPQRFAYKFSSEDDAREFIDEINTYPDKFIRQNIFIEEL